MKNMTLPNSGLNYSEIDSESIFGMPYKKA